ncbi:hypothetical protein G6F68_021065 [Rhizopus microsporus]|nr:hypothetical protein G6F68_021065 [Rhizopus microsporus]
MALAHLLDRLGDAGSIGHVQLDRFHRQALGLQLQCLLHGGLALAAGQQRVHAGLRQLAHGLGTDAAGSAGDQRDLVLMGIHGCMPCEGKAAAGR